MRIFAKSNELLRAIHLFASAVVLELCGWENWKDC
jgi:hypothetical protein